MTKLSIYKMSMKTKYRKESIELYKDVKTRLSVREQNLPIWTSNNKSALSTN